MKWKCEFCNKKYFSKNKAVKCEKDCKSKIKKVKSKWRCEVCNNVYLSKKRAGICEKSHKQLVQEKYKPTKKYLEWVCEYCNKEFNTKEEAEQHEKYCEKRLEGNKLSNKSNIKKEFIGEIDNKQNQNLVNEEVKEINSPIQIQEDKKEVTSAIFEKSSIDKKLLPLIFKESKKEPSLEEVNDFYEQMRKMPKQDYNNIEDGVYSQVGNFNLFRDFIANTKESLDICTNVFSDKTLIEIFNCIKDEGIKIRIISNRNKDKKWDFREYFRANNIKTAIDKYSLNHSKFIIRDNEVLLTGSANLDDASLYNYFETNAITNNKDSVNKAIEVFNSVIQQRDLRINNLSNFVFSGHTLNDLPKCLEPLIKNEHKKVIIVCSLGLFHKRVLNKIFDLNPEVNLKIILGGSWPKNNSCPVDKDTIDFLNSGKYKEIKNLEIEFKKEQIHSKVYIFEEQCKMLVSSMNLTEDSWGRMIESGLFIDDKAQIKKVIKSLNEIPNKEYVSESYKEVLVKVYTPKSEEVDSKEPLKTPWLTAYEAEGKQKIQHKKVVVDKKVITYKDEENASEVNQENFVGGGRYKEKPLIGHSFITSFPSITRTPIKGKKYSRKKDLEAQIFTCKRNIEEAKSKQEKIRWENALIKIKEELFSFD